MTFEQENKNPVAQPVGRALLLMALVWPGAGQMVQKRWIAGLLYAAVSLAGIVAACIYVVRTLVAWYGVVDHDMTSDDLQGIKADVGKMVVFVAATIFVWVVSVVDLYVSHLRRRRKQLRAQFIDGADRH